MPEYFESKFFILKTIYSLRISNLNYNDTLSLLKHKDRDRLHIQRLYLPNIKWFNKSITWIYTQSLYVVRHSYILTCYNLVMSGTRVISSKRDSFVNFILLSSLYTSHGIFSLPPELNLISKSFKSGLFNLKSSLDNLVNVCRVTPFLL